MRTRQGLLDKVFEILVPLMAGIAAAMVSLAADAAPLFF